MSCDHDRAPEWPAPDHWPAPHPDPKAQRLSRKDRSVINRQAYRASQLFENQERKRLRGLPHLSKSEANRLAHQLARRFYVEERQRLMDLASP